MWCSTVGVLITFTLSLLAVPLAVEAQPPATVRRIGLLGISPDIERHNIEVFRQGLRDLGHVEGQHLVMEYRWGEGKGDRLAALAAELVRLQVDCIVATGTQAIQAAKHATTTIPIVMVAASDPAGAGLVTSLARPGGT